MRTPIAAALSRAVTWTYRHGDYWTSAFPPRANRSIASESTRTRRPALRVHDLRRGERLASLDLPARLHAGPISYEIASGDEQFLASPPERRRIASSEATSSNPARLRLAARSAWGRRAGRPRALIRTGMPRPGPSGRGSTRSVPR